MILTKGEFCQFSLISRLKLLKEYGSCICQRVIAEKLIVIYKIYDFYVEVIYSIKKSIIEKVEPVRNLKILFLYEEMNE
jgi:hypothetical protein